MHASVPPEDDPVTPAPAAATSPIRALPFLLRWPLLAGALTGIVIRLLYGRLAMEAMYLSFLVVVPLLIGVVTVFIAERHGRRSWGYYLWSGAFANVLFVLGTLAIAIEGLICAVLVAPMFAILGAVGGLLMCMVSRWTRWPRQRAMASIALLPFIGGVLEPRLPSPAHVEAITRHIVIHAPPETVWERIWEVRDIQPAEVERAWMYRIGVPLPVSGITRQTPHGLARSITMGKQIHFDQIVEDWAKNRFVRWSYRFDENSFPPAAMDDHVRIGGRYFDLRSTSYTLTPVADSTLLTIRIEYRVSTHFNWYANPIAQVLIGNFEDVILDFYRRRSEAAVPADENTDPSLRHGFAHDAPVRALPH